MTLPQNNSRQEVEDLKSGLRQLQIDAPEDAISALMRHGQLIREYEGAVHLLSHGDYSHIVRRHILVSLMGFHVIRTCATICDVGAGAGFPSIPLSICLPEIQFTLFESKMKKAEFLRRVVSCLPLENVEVRHERAEQHQERKFEGVLLKAAGKIRDLVKTIDGLMDPGGMAIFYKTQGVGSEIEQARKILDKREFSVQVKQVRTPIEQKQMALVIIRKSVERKA